MLIHQCILTIAAPRATTISKSLTVNTPPDNSPRVTAERITIEKTFHFTTIFISISFFPSSPTPCAQGPQVSVDKPFLWADGRVNLKASLNKAAYVHGENVTVTLDIKNDSRKIVRKIRVSTYLYLPTYLYVAMASVLLGRKVSLSAQLYRLFHMHACQSS